jgi:enterobactin synthetase component D
VHAAPKRRRDYLAGRYCAREALRALAPELAESTIETGGGREPLWPDGFVGSITHTDGFASAAVAKSSDLAAVGIDSERKREVGAMARLERHILTSAETALLRATGLPAALGTVLVFSAKEAVFKCLYPAVRQLWGHDEVQVTCLDVTRGTFSAHGASTRAAGAWPTRGVEGRFVIHDGCVHTSAFVGVN